jgi:hypothetical protein
MDGTHIFIISLFDKDHNNEVKITPQTYGSLVNVIGLRCTISYVGQIQNNKVEIGVETVSSGWTRASLQTAIEQYPTIQEKYTIQVHDKE